MSVTLAFPHVEGFQDVHAPWDEAETTLQRELAEIMIASAKLHMPDVPVVMWTDEKTPALRGADRVMRKPIDGWTWIPWVCDCAAETPGEVLYMDTDVFIQYDLRPLFSIPADVIFTFRGLKLVDDRMQPFLFGVVPYRSQEFWAEVRDRVLKMPLIEQHWYGSQMAVFDMWMEEQQGRGKWKIATVDRNKYNYSPKTPMDTPADKVVLHYKGKQRKEWMRQSWRHLIEREVAA